MTDARRRRPAAPTASPDRRSARPAPAAEAPCAGGPRWQRRPEARRHEIVEAAVTVFGREGFQQATLADVARGAGVCPGTVAHYFGSKGALFEAVIAERLGGFVAGEEALVTEVRRGAPAAPVLRALLRHLWDFALQPGVMPLVRVVRVNAATFPESAQVLRRAIGERWLAVIGDVLRAGIRRGEFAPVDVEAAERLLGATLVGIADQLDATGPVDARMPARERMWEATLAMVETWLAPARPARSGREPAATKTRTTQAKVPAKAAGRRGA